jgi:RsiW-degrading membrane proteinase PrsW (M82 family)
LSRVRTVVATEILLLVGLAALVGVCFLIQRVGGVDQPIVFPPLPAFLLSALPAALWLAYFYSQDRHEPEPKSYVIGVSFLGAVVAGPCSRFLIGELSPDLSVVPPELSPFSLPRLIQALFVVGLTQEFTQYLVVRYGIYRSREFDEPMDGVVYMTAAGIGFATYQNFIFLQGAEGAAFLASGVAQVVVNTLAHACFAGFLGHALGIAKFWRGRFITRQLVLLGGLMAAATLNALFTLIRDVMVVAGLEITPWRGVAFGFGFAAVMFLILSFMMQRLLSQSPHAP